MIVPSLKFFLAGFRPFTYKNVNITNQIYKDDPRQLFSFNYSSKYYFSLNSEVKKYMQEMNKLSIDDHIKYFYQFLLRSEQVNTKSDYWVQLTKNIMKQLDDIPLPKKVLMLKRLSVLKIDCQLKEQLQKQSFQSIDKMQIVGLCRVLRSLMIQRQLTSQAQKKVDMIYNRLFELFPFFKSGNILKMRQNQIIKYLSSFQLGFLEGDRKQHKKQMFKQVSQNSFLIDLQLYIKLCRQFYKVKIPKIEYSWFFYWFITSPFIGNNAKSNLQIFENDNLKIHLHYFSMFDRKILYSSANLAGPFTCGLMEHLVKTQTQTQIQIIDFKGQVFFLYYQAFLKMVKSIFIVLTSKKDQLETSKRIFYQSLFQKSKIYINAAFQKIYAHSKQFKSDIEKKLLSQVLPLYLQSGAAQIQIFKNLLAYIVLDLKMKNIKYKELNRILNAIISAKLSKQDRLKLISLQKLIWIKVWKQYPQMKPTDRDFVKQLVKRNKETKQFQVLVPNNIKI